MFYAGRVYFHLYAELLSLKRIYFTFVKSKWVFVLLLFFYSKAYFYVSYLWTSIYTFFFLESRRVMERHGNKRLLPLFQKKKSKRFLEQNTSKNQFDKNIFKFDG